MKYMKSQEERWLLAEKYGGVKTEGFYADCKALALGTPLGYLIGQVPFLDCTIWLDAQPLVPRMETEFWVEQAIKTVKKSSKLQSTLAGLPSGPIRILDLCAGSGCIGVAVAEALPRTNVDFAEIDIRLLPTIEKNVATNCPNSATNLYHSNLFQGIPLENRYDFILSNPPYIDPTIDRATESVKSHEPHLALYGGVDGLEIIEQIISTAKDHLTPTGQLWIEHEPEQVNHINKLAADSGFNYTSHADQYGVLRYSILVVQ
jgi:HemK-like putative methylase